METISDVPREKLEVALQQIRADVAHLHRDIAGAAANETRWIFLVLWVTVGDLLHGMFDLSPLYAIGASALLVWAYRVLDGIRITANAMRRLNEPLEPMYDTSVEL